MFDSNVFDLVKEDIPLLRKWNTEIEVYVTSVQIEELKSIPDAKKAVREMNLMALEQLSPECLATIFTFDRIDFSYFSFQSNVSYGKILKESKSNINDAIIGATAIHEGCILITNDTELFKKVNKAKAGSAMNYTDFCATYLTATDGKR